ncbi:5761_t:CDS:2 [Dentiscutata erythropus]|uniref:tRNA N(3)-methylcytidine methyltransferase n=1 Tax=Dentiscutata erythropus TaxID=1348616 RepID=A0A9N9G2Z4_9GLOM|nr:5761_t:CDS:2 [Dentiscutata erythropus]
MSLQSDQDTDRSKLKKDWSSVRDIREDTPTFGTRILENKEHVWNHNAWDNVEWDEEQERYAKEKVLKQSNKLMPLEEQQKYHQDASKYWNTFYLHNENKFFKDRQWLKIEFPELHNTTESDVGSKKIFEIGCGAGNTMFPLLSVNQNPELFIYACDFALNAVEVVKNNPAYNPQHSSVFVWDLTSTNIPENIEPGSLDIVVLIFVMSAIHPQCWSQAVENVYKMLKPGGLVLFRGLYIRIFFVSKMNLQSIFHYGRYDMVQLRFKEGRMLSDNFYVRGDGTRVYFFTSDEIQTIWGTKFTLEQNAIDRRLIVNRHRRLQMYRIWLQGKFRKIEEPNPL